MSNIDYSLYLLADTGVQTPEFLLANIKSLVDAGVACVQLRMKNLDDNEQLIFSQQMKACLANTGVPLIINDKLELALAIDADGLHIGQRDMHWQLARRQLGLDKILGLSIENMEQALRNQHADVDYFGVGPVFNTHSKMDAAPAIGPQQLQTITNTLPKPVVAIGGISLTNLSNIWPSSIAGVALISAIWSAPDPIAATKQFKETLSS